MRGLPINKLWDYDVMVKSKMEEGKIEEDLNFKG